MQSPFEIANLVFNDIEIRVPKRGWPSEGDIDVAEATLQAAPTYNRNLFVSQMENEGTPSNRRMRLEAYLVALCYEELKPGAASERCCYGVGKPD
ncbi:hypothetical protein AAHE18_19G158700 [Arachis hypogaea]